MAKGQKYNGWENYETWNVALWIGNDEGLYTMARGYRKLGYRAFAKALADDGMVKTADGVYFMDDSLSIRELDRMIKEL